MTKAFRQLLVSLTFASLIITLLLLLISDVLLQAEFSSKHPIAGRSYSPTTVSDFDFIVKWTDFKLNRNSIKSRTHSGNGNALKYWLHSSPKDDERLTLYNGGYQFDHLIKSDATVKSQGPVGETFDTKGKSSSSKDQREIYQSNINFSSYSKMNEFPTNNYLTLNINVAMKNNSNLLLTHFNNVVAPSTLSTTSKTILDNQSHDLAKVSQITPSQSNQYTNRNDLQQIRSTNSSKSFYAVQVPPTPGVRLGNSLFMYASLLGVAAMNNLIAVYPKNGSLRNHFQITSASTSDASDTGLFLKVMEPRACAYNPSVEHLSEASSNIKLVGYLQSWKYFSQIDETIRREFTFSKQLQRQAEMFLHKTVTDYNLTNGLNKTLFIGVHIRRGDMIGDYNVARGYRTSTIDYLLRATYYILDTFHLQSYTDFVFVVCTDDIPWSKANFRSTEITDYREYVRLVKNAEEVCDPKSNQRVVVVYSEDRSAEEDLALLAQCNHTIMTVGTFGWWAGWLAGGVTMYDRSFPAEYSVMALHFQREDFYPPHWIGL